MRGPAGRRGPAAGPPAVAAGGVLPPGGAVAARITESLARRAVDAACHNKPKSLRCLGLLRTQLWRRSSPAGPGENCGGRQGGGTMGLAQLRTGGGAAVASALRRALGVLWLADALLKILIPFGDRAAHQWYEPIMTADTRPPRLHHFLAWDASLFADHPFLWWLPAGVELGIGLWLVTRPGSRRALAVSAAWALVVWVAGEGAGGLLGGVSSVPARHPGAAPPDGLAAPVLVPARRPRDEAAAAAEA